MTMSSCRCSCLGGGLPVAVMLGLNVVAAVMVSLVKVAMNGGMNPLVIVTLQAAAAHRSHIPRANSILQREFFFTVVTINKFNRSKRQHVVI